MMTVAAVRAARQQINQPVPELDREATNHAIKSVAQSSRDADDYLFLCQMLDLDPLWSGPRPWRTPGSKP